MHPDLSPLLQHFRHPLEYFDNEKLRIGVERPAKEVDRFVSISTYLLLYVASVADAALGTKIHDTALTVLDRFEEVRGPSVLLGLAREKIGTDGGVWSGTTAHASVDVVGEDGNTTIGLGTGSQWAIVRHEAGLGWFFDDGEGLQPVDRQKMSDDFVRTVREMRLALEQAVVTPGEVGSGG